MKSKPLTANSLKNTTKKPDYIKPYTKISSPESRSTKSSNILPCKETSLKLLKKILDNYSQSSKKKNNSSNLSLRKITRLSMDLRKPLIPSKDLTNLTNLSKTKRKEEKMSTLVWKSSKTLKLMKITNLKPSENWTLKSQKRIDKRVTSKKILNTWKMKQILKLIKKLVKCWIFMKPVLTNLIMKDNT